MSRAGNRIPKFRPGYGRVSDKKIAWLRTYPTDQIAVQKYDNQGPIVDDDGEEIQSGEVGPTYLLLIPVLGRKYPLKWNLTNMTSEELAATRQFFNYLFDLAEPVVRERDKVASDAFANGDDSYSRSFRGLPQLVIREGSQRENDQSVHERPEGSHERNGESLDLDGRVRDFGDELADDESGRGGSQDDEQATD